MSKIQPQDEIGPNNAGKMIIRGICLPVSYQVDALLTKKIEEYLSARGTVSDIALSEKKSDVQITKDEIVFISSLIDKLKKIEFLRKSLPEITAIETESQVIATVNLVRDELDKFLMAQKVKGIKMSNIEISARTIVANVESRKAVDYKATECWPESNENQNRLFTQRRSSESTSSEGSYSPPSLDLVTKKQK